MKPCLRNKKLIAWLALDELHARKASALRAHIASCEGCRRYWEEISGVAQNVAVTVPDSDIETSRLFHRRVAERLAATRPRSPLENMAEWLGGALFNWRMALPVGAALVVALGVLVARQQPATPSVQSEAAVPARNMGGDLEPTVANYQMAASQSMDKLSELLTEQGNKSLPPAPVYTVLGCALENGRF
jgi:anti-sigma-K factor RskA